MNGSVRDCDDSSLRPMDMVACLKADRESLDGDSRGLEDVQSRVDARVNSGNIECRARMRVEDLDRA